MEGFTVHCPLGDCHGAVRLRDGTGVYYVQAYESDPTTPVGYREPSPDATVGGTRFVDERRRQRLAIECSAGHYLRLSLADERVLDAEECVYGPVDTDTVRCPSCAYAFGTWEEFVLSAPGPTETVHELTAVTATSAMSTDVSELTKETLTDHERFAHRRACPNCGTLTAFNYQQR